MTILTHITEELDGLAASTTGETQARIVALATRIRDYVPEPMTQTEFFWAVENGVPGPGDLAVYRSIEYAVLVKHGLLVERPRPMTHTEFLAFLDYIDANRERISGD